MNRFGDAKNTFYNGATPLFNQRSGRTKDVYQYILENHSTRPWNLPLTPVVHWLSKLKKVTGLQPPLKTTQPTQTIALPLLNDTKDESDTIKIAPFVSVTQSPQPSKDMKTPNNDHKTIYVLTALLLLGTICGMGIAFAREARRRPKREFLKKQYDYNKKIPFL